METLVKLESLDGIATEGNLILPGRHEVLIEGVIKGTSMTLMYRSTTLGRHNVTVNRLVFCEQRELPNGDFRWRAREQRCF